jgi:hypothetical protein
MHKPDHEVFEQLLETIRVMESATFRAQAQAIVTAGAQYVAAAADELAWLLWGRRDRFLVHKTPVAEVAKKHGVAEQAIDACPLSNMGILTAAGIQKRITCINFTKVMQ